MQLDICNRCLINMLILIGLLLFSVSRKPVLLILQAKSIGKIFDLGLLLTISISLFADQLIISLFNLSAVLFWLCPLFQEFSSLLPPAALLLIFFFSTVSIFFPVAHQLQQLTLMINFFFSSNFLHIKHCSHS